MGVKRVGPLRYVIYNGKIHQPTLFAAQLKKLLSIGGRVARILLVTHSIKILFLLQRGGWLDFQLAQMLYYRLPQDMETLVRRILLHIQDSRQKSGKVKSMIHHIR